MRQGLLPEYQRLLQVAEKNQKENKEFVRKLRRQKPKDLDTVTHALHDLAFKKIDCLKCGNCCATTGPLLKVKDIDSLAASKKMKPADFTTTFLKIDEDGDFVFKSLPCPFLRTDNYCSVYEARPGACKEYPHTQQRNILTKLPITFLNSMICPAVAVVLEGLKKHYQKEY